MNSNLPLDVSENNERLPTDEPSLINKIYKDRVESSRVEIHDPSLRIPRLA